MSRREEMSEDYLVFFVVDARVAFCEEEVGLCGKWIDVSQILADRVIRLASVRG